MSINIVKEKSPKTPKSKLRIIDAKVEYPVVVEVKEVKEKKPRKVSLKKTEPVVEKEPESEEVFTPAPPVVEKEPEPESEEVFIPAPPVVEPPVVEVQAPVVVDTVFVAETPESELELFKKLSKKIYKEKRQAKLKALTPEELEAKRAIARQKNKEYRANNKDKIKVKDKKYATEKAPIIKQKRVAKLKDPVEKAAYNERQRLYKAKKRAEAKASTEPKPPKAAKMSKAQQRDFIMSNAELTAEQKLEQLAKLI